MSVKQEDHRVPDVAKGPDAGDSDESYAGLWTSTERAGKMEDEEGLPGEVSPVNPAAIRGPSGIWNEETLPVMDWEAPEHRVVLPEELLIAWGIPTPVLRWSREKLIRVQETRPRDAHVVRELSRYLERWMVIGEEAGFYRGNIRILLQDEVGRWCAVSVGELQGSYNVITVIGGSDVGFYWNRLAGMIEPVTREK